MTPSPPTPPLSTRAVRAVRARVARARGSAAARRAERRRRASDRREVTRQMRRSAYEIVPGGGHDIRRPRVVGMIRMRNESLILQDTLDHLARYVDAIVVFDD